MKQYFGDKDDKTDEIEEYTPTYEELIRENHYLHQIYLDESEELIYLIEDELPF